MGAGLSVQSQDGRWHTSGLPHQLGPVLVLTTTKWDRCSMVRRLAHENCCSGSAGTAKALGEAGLSMLFGPLWKFRFLVLVLNHSSRTWGDSVDFSMGIYLDWDVSLKPTDEIQQSCWHGGVAPSALESSMWPLLWNVFYSLYH